MMWKSYNCLSSRLASAKLRSDYEGIIADAWESYTSLSVEQTVEKAKLLGLIQQATAELLEVLSPSEPYGWEDK